MTNIHERLQKRVEVLEVMDRLREAGGDDNIGRAIEHRLIGDELRDLVLATQIDAIDQKIRQTLEGGLYELPN